jgi:hypothetical protein
MCTSEHNILLKPHFVWNCKYVWIPLSYQCRKWKFLYVVIWIKIESKAHLILSLYNLTQFSFFQQSNCCSFHCLKVGHLYISCLTDCVLFCRKMTWSQSSYQGEAWGSRQTRKPNGSSGGMLSMLVLVSTWGTRNRTLRLLGVVVREIGNSIRRIQVLLTWGTRLHQSPDVWPKWS